MRTFEGPFNQSSGVFPNHIIVHGLGNINLIFNLYNPEMKTKAFVGISVNSFAIQLDQHKTNLKIALVNVNQGDTEVLTNISSQNESS